MAGNDDPTEFYSNFPSDQDLQPQTPWYRKPPLLVGWVLLVLILIGLITWGLFVLFRGESGPGFPTPTTTPSTTTTTTTTTTAPTTTPTTTPETTTASAPAGEEPPQTSEAPPTTSKKHHLPELPSTITVPSLPKLPHVPELPTEIPIPQIP